MSKNRKVKRPTKSKAAAPRVSRAPKPQPGRDSGRSREIVGIVSLGVAIFVVAALMSLQAGDGRLMGPVGRAIALTVYAFAGLCSYLIVGWLCVVALRLLTDRDPATRLEEGLGIGIGIVSLATLIHLIGSGYRIGDHAPGGLVGEHVAEVLRAVISTAGTALFASMCLVLAVVISTPLRMRSVIGHVKGGALYCWAHAVTAALFCWARAVGAARATWQFVGEVIHAVLPERDHDEYLEDHAEWESGEYDAFELEEGADPAFVEPPIIDARSGPTLAAVPEPVDDHDDTERIDEEQLAEVLAEARATEEAAAGQTKAPKRTKKKSKKTKSPTLPGVGEQAPEPSGGPIIVEPFAKVASEELAEKAAAVDAQRLDFIPLGDGEYQLPPIHLLDYDESQGCNVDRIAMLELSARLTQTLEHYKIKGEVVAIRPGPVVTMYEFAPAPGTRVNKISNLADDLAMALEALRVRIVAPIPGKAAVGIEVPNKSREVVYLKEVLADDVFLKSKFKLPIAVGKDIEGAPAVVDLAKMPHLLVAGTTGSGKSVSVNAMIASLLYKATPEEVRMIMVDPKMLELSIYEGIPHLLLPVVTDPKKANLALRWAVDEMERRYQVLSEMRVRDISSYNKKVKKEHAKWEAERLQQVADEAARAAEEEDDVEVTEERQMMLPALEEPAKPLPFIVIVIDEFADLMMCAPKEVETSVARIAQKARAAGIHLILATQRPSVNVITGIIKANFPSRAAFHVTSKVDSRTILDQGGAERLLGAGDMLFSDRGASPQRLHGAFIDEHEISRIVEFLKGQGKPVYDLEILKPREEDGPDIPEDEVADEMYDRAIAIVAETRQVSISMIQRRLRVGYNRAARMVEFMEKEGVVGPPDGTNRREVLLAPAA